MREPCKQEWYNPSQDAAWRVERPGPAPFKRATPWFRLPSGNTANKVIIDVAHTWHIKGIGCDFAASAIVLCARKGLFGFRTLEKQLDVAYGEFMQYCARSHKTTSIRTWSTKPLMGMANLRSFPSTIQGKGYDTGIVSLWLSDFLHNKDRFCFLDL